jgi:hypothetical protein
VLTPPANSANIAMGANASATGDDSSSIAIGTSAQAQGRNSVTIGPNAVDTRDSQFALGTTANTYTMAGTISAASKGPKPIRQKS